MPADSVSDHPATPDKALVFFFLIAYAGTWLVQVPISLSEAGLLPPFSIPRPLLAVVSLVAIFLGPFLAAFLMTGITEGRAGLRRFLRRFVLWRVGLRWYLFVLVGVPAIIVLGAISVPGALASFDVAAIPSVLPFLGSFLYVLILGGPLGEEPGWRGFALPRLQRLHGPLVGSLILGSLWSLWHLPLFWQPAWNIPPTIINVVLFVLDGIAVTIVFTWVFNNTKGSLLIAILLHTSMAAEPPAKPAPAAKPSAAAEPQTPEHKPPAPDVRDRVDLLEATPAPETKPKPKEQSFNPFSSF